MKSPAGSLLDQQSRQLKELLYDAMEFDDNGGSPYLTAPVKSYWDQLVYDHPDSFCLSLQEFYAFCLRWAMLKDDYLFTAAMVKAKKGKSSFPPGTLLLTLTRTEMRESEKKGHFFYAPTMEEGLVRRERTAWMLGLSIPEIRKELERRSQDLIDNETLPREMWEKFVKWSAKVMEFLDRPGVTTEEAVTYFNSFNWSK
jgi:hypothetical protein